MQLNEGHEDYTNPDPARRASREIPVGPLHAVRPGDHVSLCTEESTQPLQVTDSGLPWRSEKLQACRDCRAHSPDG